MKYFKNSTIAVALVVLAGLAIAACQEQQWDEHGKTTVEGVDGTLLQALQANPEAAKFCEALEKTGYSALLAEGNNFTVFVAGNDAWAGVDMNDVENLRVLVANQIAYEKHLTSDATLHALLQLASGKVLNYTRSNSFNGAAIVSGDYVATNGVYHMTDKLINVSLNIWEYIQTLETNNQVQYISGLTVRAMDDDRSHQTGVNQATGRPEYDTVWTRRNNFLLQTVRLDDESQLLTYVVLKNDGFDSLVTKFKPFFVLDGANGERTDSLTKAQICSDFAFAGIVDIAAQDTIININDVKVPFSSAIIEGNYYEASNGRVYVIDQSNILYREKFKPLVIQGENFTRADRISFTYVRGRTWADQGADMMLYSGQTQSDSIHYLSRLTGTDSVVWKQKIFSAGDHNTGLNNINSWVEYKQPVNSVNYKIHYLAYDDRSDHRVAASKGDSIKFYPSSPDSMHIMRLYQKFFISLPGRAVLSKGAASSNNAAILNNYLGNTTCFVAVDTAGIMKERIMSKWTLNLSATAPQTLAARVTATDADVLAVPSTGVLTMWLCNTANRAEGVQEYQNQGFLFMDYIKLTPVLPAEK
ncbi:MAG: fasciclin domain-containing protein [Bacteroidales bacterium]|nr:fasciclin domain-containing protein [Bacteroidales bacterium]